MDLDKEQQQIAKAKTDPEAFGAIFDAYYQPILGYTVRRVGDVATAEEIVAETFMKALKSLGKFRWQGVSIEAWLYKIASNEIRMHFRRHRFTASLEELHEQSGFEPVDEEYDIAAEAQSAQDMLARHQDFVRAQKSIATLPIKYQEVLVLRFAESKKIGDIAAILGKREGTVKSLLSRGLARLRKTMQSPKVQPIVDTRIVGSEGQIKP